MRSPAPPSAGTGRHFDAVERRRFPALLAAGGALAAVVLVVAFVADATLAWPLLVLVAICLTVAIAFRLVAGPGRADTTTRSRPLGDTAEAHDEISPHDIPLYSPARHAAKRQAGARSGTTRGNSRGGAAGRGSAADDELVGTDEKDGARL